MIDDVRTSLEVRCPRSFGAERAYVLDVLLRRFLGLDFHIVTHERVCVEIALGDRRLVVRDAFLGGDERAWLTPASMPRRPLARLDTRPLLDHPGVPAHVPVIYGEASLKVESTAIELGLDVFASSFFLLTRYEELVGTERDQHDRFPGSASLAAAEGFLDYPIVDIYVEILWACLRRLWPVLERRPRQSRTLISCDVDLPFNHDVRSWSRAARRLASYVVKERSLAAAARHVREAVAVRLQGDAHDSFYTFDDYMSWAEAAGLQVAFYFIAGHTGGAIDGYYELNDAPIRALLCQIHARKHEIGLHPSYGTYRAGSEIAREFSALRSVCRELGIEQAAWGGRQHFLRWHPSTFRSWDEAGLTYDSTLTFADRAGFRAGVCHEYPAYDLEARVPLRLLVRPLIAMDASLLNKGYMGLSHADAAGVLDDLSATCRMFDGDFTLLWHNSSLVTAQDRQLLRRYLVR